MFEYNYDPRSKELFVELPSKLEFNYTFLRRMAGLTKKINELNCSGIKVSCKKNSYYDNLSKAYMFNILRHISLKKNVMWNKELNSIITTSIHSQDGRKFSPIEDIIDFFTDTWLSYYRFHGDVGIDKPVEEISNLLVDKNVVFNENEIKEFLSTTIGEIFSNSINHSKQDELFFMYDIKFEDENFYLYVNIVDYGTTIVENVKKYFIKTENSTITSYESMKWAIQSGNTTRAGSGGYGLPTLISYITEVNGELIIFSGDACYHLNEQDEQIDCMDEAWFTGTSVTFKVKLFETSQIIKYDCDKEKLVSVSLDNI